MKKILISVLCALLTAPAPASLAPRADRPLRLGVIRFEDGELEKPKEKKGAGERRLGRWLENLESIAIETETLPPVHRRDIGDPQGTCESLRGLLHACQMAMTLGEEGTASPESCQRLKGRAEESAKRGNCGPEVQKGWVMESTLAEREGDRPRAERFIRKAVSLHPHGFLASPFEWEKEPRGFDAARFWGTVKTVKETLLRDCRIDLKDAETFDSIYVNGFALEPTSRLQLHRQGRWLVLAKKGTQTFRGLASCRAPESLRQGLDLRREDHHFELRSQLADVAEMRNLDSLLVVQPVHDQIRIYLFQSRDARLREVPLDKPISVREWERQPADASLPIAREKLVAWLNAEPRAASDAAAITPSSTLDTRLGGENERWYNNSTFWWVTAGVAASVATIFLLTQHGQVRPNPSIRVELP